MATTKPKLLFGGAMESVSKYFLCLMAACFLSVSAQAEYQYYCNGKYKQYDSYFYHPNGKYLKYDSYLYHPNGKYLKYDSYFYHPNGKYLKYDAYFYHPNGKYLKYDSYFYHENGKYLKYGNECYFDNGTAMGKCPATYTVSSSDGENGVISTEINLKDGAINRYTVRVAGDGYVETYSVDMSGQLLDIDATCSGGSGGEVNSETVDSIMRLYNQSNAKTTEAVKSQICR